MRLLVNKIIVNEKKENLSERVWVNFQVFSTIFTKGNNLLALQEGVTLLIRSLLLKERICSK